MKCFVILILFLWLGWHAELRAEITAFDQPLQEEQEVTITCELKQAPKQKDIPVFDSAKDVEQSMGTYHYKLWLPKGYLADSQRRWPCIFITSPDGNAGMGQMGPWLKSNGYVVVMLVESKNGPWGPIVGNFLAAHDDVVHRVRIQEGLKFATGMSGGARASSIFVQIRSGFSGLILQAASVAYDGAMYHVAGIKRNPALWVVITMGDKDDNKSEVSRMNTALNSAHFLALSFDGGHEWAPRDVFERAITWIERGIYEEGPSRPDCKPIYIQRFRTQFDKLHSLTAPWERFKEADSLLIFCRNRGLMVEPRITSQVQALQKDLARLRADPTIGKEIFAADALRRLEQNRKRTSRTVFTSQCSALARQYSGTEAAERAKQLADGSK
jgi:hypothetical protein